MARESKVYGSAKAYPIFINGVYLFRIGSGDCVTFKIPTGQSEIDLVTGMKQVRFISEKGKKYYFYVNPHPELRQLTEEEWNEKQKACNWVELKKEKGD
jgi:type 1 glutamine amidotransferase